MFYIYILYSPKADKFYTGHSQNPWIRLEQHNTNSIEKFTGKFNDWELKAIFSISDQRKDADKIERFIKKQKSRTLLTRLIDPAFIPTGILAQLVRVPHMRD